MLCSISGLLQRFAQMFNNSVFGSRTSSVKKSPFLLVPSKSVPELGAGNCCSVCQKSFSTPGSLKRHMELHMFQRKNFVCQICDKRFSWKTDWRNHVRLKHNMA
ncbi:hypothetical protein CEXT_471661 [Caerostris extrusa]|uniref:C2H2-type domain-containing protein n=1 Tax=Caerostris extrusa TaxID=172846 RepID=A0AAV4NC17_CAEEX|nr:hypothetical protein CEXT_471661 [Caerostris extrusa]